MYLENLVSAWGFWLVFEPILVVCPLNVRPQLAFTPNNTSFLLAFIYFCLQKGLVKKWNFPGLALKLLWWNDWQILDICIFTFSIISSKFSQ